MCARVPESLVGRAAILLAMSTNYSPQGAEWLSEWCTRVDLWADRRKRGGDAAGPGAERQLATRANGAAQRRWSREWRDPKAAKMGPGAAGAWIPRESFGPDCQLVQVVERKNTRFRCYKNEREAVLALDRFTG